MIHVDTGWYEEEWVCDLEFSQERFPDPKGMLERLREMGFRVSLWQLPYLLIESALFEEAAAKGYLAKRPYSKPYLFSGFLNDAGLLDYSNPEAVAWMQEKFTCLFQMGVAAIKADFGEGAPPEALYHSVPGEAIHNLFTLLYNKAVFEVTEQFYGKGQAVIWARSAWAGSQRYPVHWSGDGIARYEDLACVLRSALSFGLSSFPFYSHDVGGFSGLPSPDLYARWLQLGVFTSHVRCHGQPPREPWEYGEQTEEIFRKYLNLRYRLFSYIYTEAIECGRSSLPMLRAMALEYQNDPACFTIEDQYLFGSSILVAPILDETGRRQIYLPAGNWFVYWDKSLLPGPAWIEVDVPLNILPLYVKAGALIPYGPIMQHAGEKPCSPLTLELYSLHQEGIYVVHNDEMGEIPIAYLWESDRLTMNIAAAPGEIQVVLYGHHPIRAAVDNQPLDLQALPYGGLGCEHVFDSHSGAWLPKRDARFQTSLPGVYIVGDVAQICGVEAARLEGRLAGTTATQAAGYLSEKQASERVTAMLPQIERQHRFGRFLQHLFAPNLRNPSALLGLAGEETIACRCEEVSIAQIRQAIAAGAASPAEIKMLTRCGMGNCQGRMCESTIIQALAEAKLVQEHSQPEWKALSIRPPLAPMPVSMLTQPDK